MSLSEITANEEVVYYSAGFYSQPLLVKVSRLTPSRRIVVRFESGRDEYFYPDGSAVHKGYSGRARIVPATPELRAQITFNEQSERLSRVNWAALPADLVSKVAELTFPVLDERKKQSAFRLLS